MWLPSVLCDDAVFGNSVDTSQLHSSFVVQGERAELDFILHPSGQLKSIKLPRWGSPDGAAPHYVDFGAIVEEESTFCGYTIPTQLRGAGTSALSGLSQRESFSGPWLMMRFIVSGKLLKQLWLQPSRPNTFCIRVFS